jgi:glycosyltransferase involved in cell wall biosynthesis
VTAASNGRTRVPELDVLRLLLQRRLAALPAGPLEIRAHDIDLAVGRDVVDLVLGLRRRDWIWTDDSGRTTAPAGIPVCVARLSVEAAWRTPVGYLRHRRRLRRLERQGTAPATFTDSNRGLFIRSDFAFNVQAGGSVGHVAGVIDGLRRDGHAVHVLSSDALVGVPADQHFHLLRPDIRSARNFSELARLEYNHQMMQCARHNWNVWRPGFVYYRYSAFNYIGPWLRTAYGVPIVCEYNGPAAWIQRNWEDRPFILEGFAERIERLNLRTADLVVVVSAALATEAIDRGAHPRRVLVNPNGVDPDTYRPDIDGAAVRQRYGLQDRCVVGFIGTIGPWHGVEQLVEAARLALRAPSADGAPLHFLIVGEGSRTPAVQNLARQYGIADRFTFTGLVPQADGPAHLAACDILASPHVPNPDGSPFFGSPTKLFEYMAIGRAIVASDLAQIGEVLEHEGTALLVPPADAAALADALLRLAGDSNLRDRLGASARRTALARHTWQQHTRRITGTAGAR